MTDALPKAVLAMRPATLAEDLFGPACAGLTGLVDASPHILEKFDDPLGHDLLADADVLVTGWGCPPLTGAVLDRAPRLRAVVHAGGSAAAVLDLATAAERGLALSNAGEANAVPVAEYTFAAILLSGKRARAAERLYRQRRDYVDREVELRDTGNYRRTVGLVGASRIGRRVARLLAQTDLDVLLYDPYLPVPDAVNLSVRLCSLPELMTASDVVSLHPPVTAETTGMIDAAMLGRMPDGATLINTARGAIVDQDALVAELRTGRISAVLDVTTPDPLPADHELWSLPNVTLTPHIAGATGSELRRLGRHVIDELARFRQGAPFAYSESKVS
ncbi:hydroxyacid dehydrogenase [Actinoplanes sp. NPDC026670]|uniref:hydroxyacid dehydrogenase n=1 Tax=Actinoplanes sp. NPDC026670 TaxID=3154700 RepID=UPI003402A4B7